MRQTVPQSHIPGGRPVLLKYTGDSGSKARSQQGRLNSLDSLLPNFCLAPRRKHSFLHLLFLVKAGVTKDLLCSRTCKATSMPTTLRAWDCSSPEAGPAPISLGLGEHLPYPSCFSLQPPNRSTVHGKAGSLSCHGISCGLFKNRAQKSSAEPY